MKRNCIRTVARRARSLVSMSTAVQGDLYAESMWVDLSHEDCSKEGLTDNSSGTKVPYVGWDGLKTRNSSW